jgi:predicted phosphodiesterase
MSSLTKVLVMPDAHHPYVHKQSWKTFLSVARGWKPDKLVILGDFVDFYSVSSFLRDPERMITLEDEIDSANAAADEISELSIPDVTVLEGNHELRLSKYISRAGGELAGLLSAQRLLKIKERGWKWVPYGKYHTIGKLHFAHDVGFSGKNSAIQSVEAFGGNIIFGHSHRAACHYISTISGDRHVGWTMGWLGDPEAIDYRHSARVARESQHGFGTAYVRKSDGMSWVNFVPIIRGTASVDGKIYSAR